MQRFAFTFLIYLTVACVHSPVTTEFCLDGELDIGVRYQGQHPRSGERFAMRWCVVSDDSTERVLYTAQGRINADLDNSWSVAYLPPDLVRIVNRSQPPDVEFRGTDNADEARRVRRLDPRRLLEEVDTAGIDPEQLKVTVIGGFLSSVETSVDMPLRGTVPVIWRWDFSEPEKPSARLYIDGELLIDAKGSWRSLSAKEAAAAWRATEGAEPIAERGERWPSQITMRTIELTAGVTLVRGVRTGFQHLVVDSPGGLIVADAPAGWLEFHHVPPSDLVPGLGTTGLSQKLIEYLQEHHPGRPLLAVALTHFHDDHAGGAAAFADAGAKVYVPGEHADFFNATLKGHAAMTEAVSDKITIGQTPNRVTLINLGANPHVGAMLGVWAVDKGYFFVSDVHVPRSDQPAPREGREITDCWFAGWATANLPADVQVVNSHSAVVSPVSRLSQFLEHPSCGF